MVDPWPAGNYGVEEENGLRLSFARSWLRTSPTDNGYARPIEGVIAVVDLNKMRVINVEDHGVVPMPPNDGNYAAEFVQEFRTDLKPLDIVQPEGPSFEVNGKRSLLAKNGTFRVGFYPARGTGPARHQLPGQRKKASHHLPGVLGRVGGALWGPGGTKISAKNAFDVGEAGIGSLANSLTLGCDCLGQIYYFDAVLNNSRGEPVGNPQCRLPSRGRLRHPLEAYRLAHGTGRSTSFPPLGHLIHRYRR